MSFMNTATSSASATQHATSKGTLHVQFCSDLSTYGEAGAGQTLHAWKVEADALMVRYLESLGYEVEEELDDIEAGCWLDEGDFPHDDDASRLLEKAWEYACANGGKSATEVAHFCQECGEEVTGDFCAAHPNAIVDSAIVPQIVAA